MLECSWHQVQWRDPFPSVTFHYSIHQSIICQSLLDFCLAHFHTQTYSVYQLCITSNLYCQFIFFLVTTHIASRSVASSDSNHNSRILFMWIASFGDVYGAECVYFAAPVLQSADYNLARTNQMSDFLSGSLHDPYSAHQISRLQETLWSI